MALLLLLTIPWFFIGSEAVELAGWPLWVVYTLGMNLVFAVVTAVLLGRCWERFERIGKEEEK